MIHNRQINLLIAVIFAIVISAMFFLEYGLNFLEMSVQQVLSTLISLGRSIAGVAGRGGFAALVVFVVGNFLLSCLVFLSTGFYSFLKGKHRPARIAISSATLIAGFSLMVIQAGFCIGFPPNAIGEGLKDISQILFGIEGLIISFLPLYYSQKSKKKSRPLTVDDTNVG